MSEVVSSASLVTLSCLSSASSVWNVWREYGHLADGLWLVGNENAMSGLGYGKVQCRISDHVSADAECFVDDEELHWGSGRRVSSMQGLGFGKLCSGKVLSERE